MTLQPSGTVTFLFTDIEGSTRLLEALGTEPYAAALDRHRALLRAAFQDRDGYEVDCEGDSFFVAFGSAGGAVAAAAEAQQALAAADWPDGREVRVRMGLHTGEPLLAPPKYVGLDVHRAARIMACAHGGQVVLSPATVSLLEPGRFDLVDLGRHRLKDLSDPIVLHQLVIDGLPRDFPALRTLDRSNLPTPATPFLGREDELREVSARLADPATRLLTLTGPGGTGKTRLALQASAEASDGFPDGVFWVPLAPLQDPALVLPSVAHVLGVTEQPGVALSETLAESQAGRRFAIVLDNVEHLLPAAATSVAELAAACPTGTLLATSRERLQLAAETTWPVPPLSAWDGERLFVERARSAGVELAVDEAVSELCRRLDELPLAIELAAARTVALTPAQLLERLSQRLDLLKGARDADPRQKTLRATIDWSYRLLDAEEQRVYRALSVFAGGCTLEAVEEVAGADVDVIQSLLDKSFLRQRDTATGRRFWMLETIREFALEQLAETGEQQPLRTAHAVWLEQLVADGAPEYFGIGAPGWLERIEAEEDNLRAALVHSRSVDPARLARIAGDVFNHWYFSSRLTEGRDWLLAAHDEAPDDIAVVRGLSNLSVRLGDTESARGRSRSGRSRSRARRTLPSTSPKGSETSVTHTRGRETSAPRQPPTRRARRSRGRAVARWRSGRRSATSPGSRCRRAAGRTASGCHTTSNSSRSVPPTTTAA